jgi:hypothetical protein
MYGGMVGADIADRKPSLSWLWPINKFTTGSMGSFGFGWEGGSAKVVETLAAARARWLTISN